MNLVAATTLLTYFAFCATTTGLQEASTEAAAEASVAMELGNFSVSLNVANLKTSRAFYEKLGFKKIQGEEEANYLIMQNSTATIGLFQGMFENNILTFNPGWNRQGESLDEFTDVRELQRQVVASGIEPVAEADLTSTGPASFIVVDPDGNTIFFDQHVPAPKR